MATYPTFENNYPLFEGTNYMDGQLQGLRPTLNQNNAQFSSDMFQPLPPFDPILPGEWLTLGASSH
jgi:hypothetical protein